MVSIQILLPVFLQVTLTVGLLIWLGLVRAAALKAKQVKGKDVSLNQPNWPENPTKIGNAFNHQFQLPVLFYVVVAYVQIQNVVDWIFVGLAWVFALSRVMHAYFYTTSNYVPNRFRAYSLGLIVLVAMWIWFAIKILGGP